MVLRQGGARLADERRAAQHIFSDFHLTITMLALQTGVGRMAEWSMAADCKSARVKRSKVRILLRPRYNLHIIFPL